MNIIPYLKTPTQYVLTADNFVTLGFDSIAISLLDILVKPGIAVLQTLSSLAAYFGFPNQIEVHAYDSFKDGYYQGRSSYDGAKFKFAFDEIMLLLNQLQVTTVLLPQEMGRDYFFYSDFNSFEALQHALGKSTSPRTVVGEFSLAEFTKLREVGVERVDSSAPLTEALAARVYSEHTTLDLSLKPFEKDFDLMDKTCLCPVCDQGFTRAYLHHLYFQTPLLCHRYLMMHNLYYLRML